MSKAGASLAGQKAGIPKNTLYLLVGALLVAVVGLGIYVYHEQTKPKDSVQIDIGKNGVSVQGN